MPNKIRVPAIELIRAGDRWDKEAPAHTMKTFNDFLGLEDLGTVWILPVDAFLLDEEQSRKIHLILGPHYKAIIKVWFVKHGYLTNGDKTSRHNPDK